MLNLTIESSDMLPPSNTMLNSQEELKLAYLIISIVNTVFIVFGTLGNLFTFFILMRRNLRTVYSYTRYLSVLCIIDIVCLYNWNFSFVYQDLSVTHMRIEHISPLACRLFSYIAYSSLQLSSWIMCAIGIDRIILLASTSRRKSVQTTTATTLTTISTIEANSRRKSSVIAPSRLSQTIQKVNPFQSTIVVFAILAVIIFATNSVVLINNATPYHGNNGNSNSSSANATTKTPTRTFTCYSPAEFFKTWDIFHVLMYSLVPFAVILIQNLIISLLTIRHAKRMKTYQQTKQLSSASQGSRLSRMVASLKNVRYSTSSQTTGGQTQASKAIARRASAQSKGTYVKNLLIFLTLSFFFTTLPYSMIYATNLNEILIRTNTGNIIKRCLISLQYTRHSTNFLIYILTSTIIQSEIKKCFKEIEFYLFKRTV